ncbi:DUF6864 domain-containing function [Aliivibrio fischeri]|uniref:DUF6864 domain-containing function n=1 Tax=Aliivibrio fischeri TaxID=668 RepID=UPI0012DA9F65|nr:hypothetical protein [Aliivibrio fischeri]MUK67670.1 hypothetical protein [Aliivibrio fischeri]
MEVVIDNKKLIYSTSLLVPNDEGVSIKFNALGWDIVLEFNFSKKEDLNLGAWELVSDDNSKASINLYNWDEHTGTALPEFVELGKTDNGDPVYMSFACYFIGSVRKFEAHFYIEQQSAKVEVASE